MVARGIEAVRNVLDCFDVPYGEDGIINNVDKWFNAKEHLITRLSQHPAWNAESLAVIVPFEEERTISEEDARSALFRMHNCMTDLGLTDTAKQLNDVIGYASHSSSVTDDMVERLRGMEGLALLPTAGMKMSRYVRKLCMTSGYDLDKDDRWRSEFSKYADIINPMNRNRLFYFSVNPADYLTMSLGNSWSSCHALVPDMVADASSCAEYRAGCMSYMVDPSSVVGYVLDADCDYEEPSYLCGKITRQMYLLHPSLRLFVQSRAYPGMSRETARKHRAIVHEILSSVGGFDNKWAAPRRGCDYSEKVAFQCNDLHYPDYLYEYSSLVTSMTVDLKDAFESGDYDGSIDVGGDPYCFLCGKRTVMFTDSHYCNTCNA